jgi:hypothetical protein
VKLGLRRERLTNAPFKNSEPFSTFCIDSIQEAWYSRKAYVSSLFLEGADLVVIAPVSRPLKANQKTQLVPNATFYDEISSF